MSPRDTRLLLIVLALLVLTAAAVGLWPPARAVAATGLAEALPATVGAYRGHEVLYCQDAQCGTVTDPAAVSGGVCPACGGPLAEVAPAEKAMLPADTRIVRKQYENGRGERVSATLVFMGASRSSLHRPQQCLPAQGYAIERTRVVAFERGGAPPLRATVLDLRRPGAGAPADAERGAAAFVYWFVSADRETPSYLGRLAAAAWDRLVRNRAAPWAYVALMTDRREGSAEHLARLRDFVRALDPLIGRQTLPAAGQ
jgi:EpsI family protein